MSQPDQLTTSQSLPELNGALSSDLGYAVRTYFPILAVAGPKARQAISNARYPDRPQPTPAPIIPTNQGAQVPVSPYAHQQTVLETANATPPQETLGQAESSHSEAPTPEGQSAAPITNIDALYAERLDAARTRVDKAYADAA